MKRVLISLILLMAIWPLAISSQDLSGPKLESQLPAYDQANIVPTFAYTPSLGLVGTVSVRAMPPEWSINLESSRINIGFHIDTRSQNTKTTIASVGPLLFLAMPGYSLEITTGIGLIDYTSDGFPDSINGVYFRGVTFLDGRILLKSNNTKEWMNWRAEFILGNQAFSQIPLSTRQLMDGNFFCYQGLAQLDFKKQTTPTDQLHSGLSVRMIGGKDQFEHYLGMGIGLNAYYKGHQPLFSLSFDYLGRDRSAINMSLDVGYFMGWR
ncbi:MAG: hypothetical protein V1765_01480 [bacterium]